MKLSLAVKLATPLVAFALPLLLLDRHALARDDDGPSAGARSSAETHETSFRRLHEGDPVSTLEIATARYKHPSRDVELCLYGMVHFADKAFYAKAKKDLAGFDVVLYETMFPTEREKRAEPDHWFGDLEEAFAGALGLELQRNGLDYASKNFVHADTSYEDQVKKATNGDVARSLEIARARLRMWKDHGKDIFKENPELRNQVLLMNAREIVQADFSRVPYFFIVERNEVALDVLEKELEKRDSGKIAILYGAGHMQDFDQRLTKKGWRQANVDWNVAWRIGTRKASTPKEDAEPAPSVPSKPRWF